MKTIATAFSVFLYSFGFATEMPIVDLNKDQTLLSFFDAGVHPKYYGNKPEVRSLYLREPNFYIKIGDLLIPASEIAHAVSLSMWTNTEIGDITIQYRFIKISNIKAELSELFGVFEVDIEKTISYLNDLAGKNHNESPPTLRQIKIDSMTVSFGLTAMPDTYSPHAKFGVLIQYPIRNMSTVKRTLDPIPPPPGYEHIDMIPDFKPKEGPQFNVYPREDAIRAYNEKIERQKKENQASDPPEKLDSSAQTSLLLKILAGSLFSVIFLIMVIRKCNLRKR